MFLHAGKDMRISRTRWLLRRALLLAESNSRCVDFAMMVNEPDE